MKIFIDHNIAGPAIATLGGIQSATDFTDVRPTQDANVEAMRRIIEQAQQGQVTLVTSDYCLETLRELLVTGGRDIEPIDEDSASTSIRALRTLSASTGGYVGDRNFLEEANAQRCAAGNIGHAPGQVDYEDLMVIATALAAKSDDLDPVLIVSNDSGIVNCQRLLVYRSIGVFTCRAWLRSRAAALSA